MTKKAMDRLWIKSTEQSELTSSPIVLVRFLRVLGVIHWDTYGLFMSELNDKVYQLKREKSARMNKAERRRETQTMNKFVKQIKPTKSR